MVIVALLIYLLQLYVLVLFVRIVLSWFPMSPDGFLGGVMRVLYALTEPILAPLRSVLPPVRAGAGAIDLSPLVVLLVIEFLLVPLLARI